MLADRILDKDIAARHCRRDHIRPRLNAVGDDGVIRSHEPGHTVDLDAVRARAADVCSHDVQIIREIDNLRLKCRILEDRLSLGTGCRHHHILRRTDTREIEIDPSPLQPVRRRGMNRPLRDVDLCAECLKALEMEINRTRSNRAAPRQRDLRTPLAGKQRSHDEKGCAHLANQFVWCGHRRNPRCVNRQPMLLRDVVRLHSERAQHRADRIDILQRRHIIQNAHTTTAEECRRDDRQHRILCPADLHTSAQRMPSVNHQLFHSPYPSLRLS